MSNPKTAEELFTVTTADAQGVLIISSAAVSFLKSFLAGGAYSYLHVALVLLELVCTGLAFVIFLIVDFIDDDGISSLEYGDDIDFYLVAFVVSILTEVFNVITTFRTVRIYQRVKRRDGMTHERIDSVKKLARRFYVFGLVYAALNIGVIPIVAFAKADWETDFFSPVDFTRQIEKLLFWAMVLNAGAQNLCYWIIIFTIIFKTQNKVQRDIAVARRSPCLPVSILCGFASLGVSITALVKVDDPKQAGGICYLFAINAAQLIEFTGEQTRHCIWMFFELLLNRAADVAETESTEADDCDAYP